MLILNGFVEVELPELPEAPPEPSESSPSAGIEFAVSDPLTGGTYRLLNVEQLRHTHLFTQVGTSENEAASFLFINPSATAASAGSVGFVGGDGTALALSIGGEPAQRTFEFTVPPLGSVEFDAVGPEGGVTGSAQLLVDNPLGGVVRTALSDLGPARLGEAKLVDSFIVPVLEEEATAVSTGVVLFNSTVESTLKLTLFSSEGNEMSEQAEGAVEIDLPAHGNRTLFVRDVFANVGDFQGTMTVEGGIDQPQQGGSVAATGIQRGASPGEFTTFPAISVAPLAATETLYFARFPNGGGSAASLVLVNPSPTERAKGTLAFFDEEGEDWAVSVNGLAPAASIPYDIAGRGSATFTTSVDGSLDVGSARATTAEGVLGGVLRWTSSAGTVNAGHSRALAGFITSAMRNSETGLNTELTLSSTESALTLSLTLRDPGGTEIAAGTTQLQLPANGQVIRTIDELFPNADTGDFTGMYCPRVLGQWFDGIRFYAAASSPRRSRRTWAGLR